MNGPYRDLVALIQFGNFAYVVTPFTNDYENVLLSTRLVGDPAEWGRFPDWGTTIIEGIDQATQLFRTFDFTNASGNLTIVFTDGRDSQLNQQSRSRTRRHRRTTLEDSRLHAADGLQPPRRRDSAGQDLEGDGRANRRTLLCRLRRRVDCARAAGDRPPVPRPYRDARKHSIRRPRFAGWVLVAVGLWLTGALLKLNLECSERFHSS